jgi:hypothetical protein
MMTSIEITSALAEFTLSAIDPELHRSH